MYHPLSAVTFLSNIVHGSLNSSDIPLDVESQADTSGGACTTTATFRIGSSLTWGVEYGKTKRRLDWVALFSVLEHFVDSLFYIQ